MKLIGTATGATSSFFIPGLGMPEGAAAGFALALIPTASPVFVRPNELPGLVKFAMGATLPLPVPIRLTEEVFFSPVRGLAEPSIGSSKSKSA